MAIAGPPASDRTSAPRQNQPRGYSAPRYSGPLPTSAEALFPALIRQESGGRAGVVGPDTQWGNALGRTQILPDTARGIARRLNIPYREDLLRGNSPEAAQYQDRLGLAYLQEGFEQTGNARDALHYYHGGPDRRLWGPKTRAYADSILSMTQRGEGERPTIGNEAQFASLPQSADQMSNEDLMAIVRQQSTGSPLDGLSTSLSRPWTRREPERIIPAAPQEYDEQGNPIVVITGGVVKNNDGSWSVPEQLPDGSTAIYRVSGDEYDRWNGLQMRQERREGLNEALSQERASLDEREAQGVRRYDDVGFFDQATAPVNDEIGWLTGYAGQALGNIGRRLTGQDIETLAIDRARAVRQLTQDGQRAYEQERPLSAAAGQVLGGFALNPTGAASLAGRIAQAAGTGFGYGVAEGDGYAGRLGTGALGAGIATATAGALEAAPVYARSLARDINQVRGRGPTITPDRARVGRAFERALERDELSPMDYLARLDANPDQVPALAGGRNVAGLAEAAAMAPGNAQVRIARALEDRAARATDRVSQELGQQFGATGGGLSAIEDAITARGDAARSAMQQIGGRPVSLTENAQLAIRSPRARSAIQDAAENRLSSMDPEVRQQGQRLLSMLEDGSVNTGGMTIRDVQDISYALREGATAAFEGGDGARGAALRELATAIRGAAREGSGDYRRFLQEFGDASADIEAKQLGMAVFGKPDLRNRVSAAQLRSQVADMTPSEVENFRLGVGEALIDRARSVQGGVGAMRALARSEEFGDRVRVAFPTEEAFEGFIRFAGDTFDESNVINRILMNSRTGARGALMDDLNQNNGIDAREAFDLARGAAQGGALGFLGQAANSVARRIPNTQANILQSPRTNEILGGIMSDQPAVRELLREMEAERLLEQIIARRTNGIRALASPGAAGAISSLPF